MAIRHRRAGSVHGAAPFRQAYRDASHVIDLTWFVLFSVGGKCGSMMI